MTAINHQQAENIANIGSIESLNITSGPAALRFQPYHPEATWHAARASRFHFATRATQLFGRTNEKEQLHKFCRDFNAKNFRWWGVTGKGGMGKSRLALELGHDLKKDHGWEWHFLGSAQQLEGNLQFFASGGFVPNAATLLVVDYAANAVDTLRAALTKLATAAESWQHPVRMLILERSIEGGWFERLMDFPSTQYRNDVVDCRHALQLLPLQPFSIDDALCLLNEVLALYNKPSRSPTECKALLAKLDAEHRPLFVLFLADAIAAGQVNALQWNSDELTGQVLDRERRRWETQGVTCHDEALLRFTTLAGELDLSSPHVPYVEQLFNKCGMNSADVAFKARWQTMLHGADHGADISQRLPRLEPDILGELFVLKTWAKPTNLRVFEATDSPWRTEFDAVWKHQKGLGLISFMSRVVMDFPTHPQLPSLLDATEKSSPPDSPFQLALLLAVSADGWRQRQEIGLAINAWKRLTTLVQRLGDAGAQPSADLLGKITVNLIGACGDAGDLVQARTLWDSIVALGTRFPNNEEIALRQAKAAVNLI
ncbi:MAG: AAA family ATPase, partial [Sulfuritalea sp.]|nr:AAA family ATPase [Sulfuritalea sp.]